MSNLADNQNNLENSTPAARLDHALDLAARGFRVFPLHDPGPDGWRPRYKGWQAAATTDSAQVRAEWSRAPNANIGIACGGPDRLVVVDLDGKDDKQGRESWAELVEESGEDEPETLTCRTGSGKGYHLFFRATSAQDIAAIKNRAGWRDGVDIRADGALVVAAGSVHKSGGCYEWIDPDMSIADLPEWLYEELPKHEPAERATDVEMPDFATPMAERFVQALNHVEELDESIAGQNGDEVLFEAAKDIRRGFALDINLARKALLYYNAKRCKPPWPLDRVEYKLDQAGLANNPRWGLLLNEFDIPPSDGAGTPANENGASKDGAPTPRPRIEWVNAVAIAEPLPPTKWIVPGLQLCPGRPALVMGYGASAKTLSTQAAAVALAAGKMPWGMMGALTPIRVRHIDHEQGKHATFKRYQRLAHGLGIALPELGDRLQVAPLPAVSLDMVVSNRQAAIDTYSEICDGVDLLLVDSLRAASGIVDENDSRIRQCLDLLTVASERTGCACVVIHHSGKGERDDDRQKARGSSAIFDAAGCAYLIEGSENPRTMKQIKMPAEAEGQGVLPFGLRVEDVQGGPTGYAYWGLRVIHEPREAEHGPAANFNALCELVYGRIDDAPDGYRLPGDVLAKEIGRNASDVRSAVTKLEAAGRIVNRGQTRKGGKRVWFPKSKDPGRTVIGDVE
jgi:hypothetical protein